MKNTITSLSNERVNSMSDISVSSTPLEDPRVSVDNVVARGMTRLLLGHDGKQFPGTMDATVWAREFAEKANQLLQEGRQPVELLTDEGWLLGWFANAIMAGFDSCRERQLMYTLGRCASAATGSVS